jgi:hypothetical protein
MVEEAEQGDREHAQMLGDSGIIVAPDEGGPVALFAHEGGHVDRDAPAVVSTAPVKASYKKCREEQGEGYDGH